MPAVINLAGVRSGRLVAVRPAGSNRQRRLWACLCDCGSEVSVESSSISSGKTKSCGCLGRDIAAARKGVDPPNKGKSYAIEGGNRVYSQKQNWSRAVIRARGDACERCGWSEARCDVHHRTPGLNTIDNGIVLCPNCHRVEHQKQRRG